MIRTLSMAIGAIALGACHFSGDAEERDPGPETSRTYDVGSFDRIAVAGPYDVKVVSGGKPGISVTGGENLLDETDVVVENGELKIVPKKRRGIRWSWNRGKATFTVTGAALREATIAGSGNIDIDRVTGDFEGQIAGSGNLSLPAVSGGKIKLGIAGSGEIVAAGKADAIDVSIAGSGDVDAKGLASRTADVTIMGSGNIAANASETADVSIMGSGDVEMTGGARCNVSKKGSGDVRCS